MNINDLKDSLFEKAKSYGFESYEIYYNDNSNFKVSVYNNKIEKYQNSESGGFCFRGIINDKMGYYFSESLDADVDAVVKNAASNAEIIDSNDKEFIFEGSKEYAKLNTYNEELDKMTPEEKINGAFEMEKIAQLYNSSLKVNSSIVSTGKSYVYIANSKGLSLEEKSNYIMAYVEVMAEKDGETKEKGEIWIGSDPKDFDPKIIAEKAAKKVISALGGNSVESGKKNVIIQNEVFADILECFAGNFYGENVQKGFSLLKDKINKQIASENITIIDNPLLENGFATTAFDSEGVATYSKNVVEKGVLKTYLYNLKSGAKDNTASTGNGFKSGFKGSVSTSTTNFYIENGTVTFDEMVEKMGNGLFITDVAGLHSGASAVSGDFSFAAEGFKVENGKITTAVNQITIAGNFYNILKSIDTVCDDLKFNSSAIGSPSLMIKDVSVAGL